MFRKDSMTEEARLRSAYANQPAYPSPAYPAPASPAYPAPASYAAQPQTYSSPAPNAVSVHHRKTIFIIAKTIYN